MPTLTPEQIEELRKRAEKIANASRNGTHPGGETVDLAALLDELAAFVRKYVVLTAHQLLTVCLWTLHTHAFEAFDATPYLSVASPEMGSGKSRLLEVEELVVARPWFTGRTSPAALYRKIDAEGSTLLLDESDAAFGADKEYSEALRGTLDTGWRRGGRATTCVGQGANITTKDFSTFSPKCIAGIGRLPGTIQDRAIVISMKRKARTETVARFRRREAAAEALHLRNRLEAWAVEAIPALTEARPAIPDELDDRAAEGWEPLLAIADLAGGDWPDRAREAALALSTGGRRERDSLGVKLLVDIRTIFDDKDKSKGADWLATNALVRWLVEMEERPWGDPEGSRLDARRLAQLLNPHEIKSKKKRTDSKTTVRGYERSSFTDAWNRYCPSPPEEAEQAEQAEQGPDTDTGDVPDVPDVPANRGMGGSA